VWLAAAGQIFFTLSVGWGILHTYASYIGPDDDLALTGLGTASLNEVAEVVLGGTIALTAAVLFFGVVQAQEIAQQGSFDLGFHAMPLALEQMPGGRIFGAMWFLLLFFAGITSSVAMLQPTIALLREDFGMPRTRAVWATGALVFLGSQPVLFFFAHGFMDQLDFWAGSFGLLLFGFVEIVIFTRIFGMARGWEEITHGAKLRIPGVFRFVIAWVMPLGMGAILLAWSRRGTPAPPRRRADPLRAPSRARAPAAGSSPTTPAGSRPFPAASPRRSRSGTRPGSAASRRA